MIYFSQLTYILPKDRKQDIGRHAEELLCQDDMAFAGGVLRKDRAAFEIAKLLLSIRLHVSV